MSSPRLLATSDTPRRRPAPGLLLAVALAACTARDPTHLRVGPDDYRLGTLRSAEAGPVVAALERLEPAELVLWRCPGTAEARVDVLERAVHQARPALKVRRAILAEPCTDGAEPGRSTEARP